MKNLILVILFGFSLEVLAEDQWFCSEESGKRDGNTIQACGVGEGVNEKTARTQALDAAIDEFKTICDMSSDCAHHQRVVEPKRLTCNEKRIKGTGYSEWKCYRLIQVTVLN